MSGETANKALAVLQTSLLVSLICSVTAGYYYSFFHDRTWSQFFYASYIIMVNKIVLPVGVATIIYCLIVSDKWERVNFLKIIKSTLLLSLISLSLLFIWNSIDVCLKFGYCAPGSEDIYQNLWQQFMLGLFFCIPVSVLIISIFSYFSRIRSK